MGPLNDSKAIIQYFTAYQKKSRSKLVYVTV